jgi:hypothetical protein
MADLFYPSIDLAIVQNWALASDKIEPEGILKVGETTMFVFKGPQAIFKRVVIIREIEAGQVCFEQATALALRCSFLGPLLTWLEENKNWKDGGYTEPQ